MSSIKENQIVKQNEIIYIPEKDPVSMLDIFLVLAKHWRFIFFSTLTAAILILGFSVYSILIRQFPDVSNPLPNYFEPEAQIILDDIGGSLNSKYGSDLSALANLAGLSSGGSVNPAQFAIALMKGNDVLDTIIDEFDIVEKLNLQDSEYQKTAARMFLKSAIVSVYFANTGILSIKFKHSDKYFATDVVNRMVDLVEARYRELTLERVYNKKQFLEERLLELDSEILKAQARIIQFQDEYGTLDISIKARETTEKISRLNAVIFEKEVELTNLLAYLPENSPQVVRIKNEIEINEKIVKELQTGIGPREFEGIPQNEIASLGIESEKIKAELSALQEMYQMFRKEYENVKIEETDNTKKFQVIQRAEVPEVKAGPSRGRICIIVTATILFLTIALSFLFEWIEKSKRDSIESIKLMKFKSYLPFRKK